MIRLDRAEGTVWQARGVLVAGSAAVPIAWRIDAWPLLRREVHIHLLPYAGQPTGSSRADIVIAGERVAVRDAEVSFPAALLAAASGAAAGWGVSGDVRMSAAALDWAPPANRGTGLVHWRAARIYVPTGNASVDLGDLAISITAAGERLSGPITNDGGDLSVRGEFAMRANDHVQVSLLLAPRRADNTQLAQVLAAIATADPGGWRVDWRLPLR